MSKQFGNVHALTGVDLRLYPGEIHALMGQNGAGKSTLIKVLTGVYQADQGVMRLYGKSIRATSTLNAQHLGISTVYQEVNLCANLSVAENIFAGRYPRHGWERAWAIDWARMQREARALLARLNLDIDVTQILSSYSVAVQQMVAIARGLSISSQILILDEPTSSLDDEEVERLYGVLRQLRDQGMAILFVTHFLDQVYAVCDRITVLRNGELVGEYPAAELGHNALIAAMIGKDMVATEHTPGTKGQGDAAALLAGNQGPEPAWPRQVVGLGHPPGRSRRARRLAGLGAHRAGAPAVRAGPQRRGRDLHQR